MFKKLLIIFLIFVLLLSAETAFAEKEEYDFAKMTTYEMFWPIVAGKVPGDRFYSLKLWRDKMVGFLFFSKIKKSEYLKQQANKRLVEAEKLIEVKRGQFLNSSLSESVGNLKKGLVLIFSAEESMQTAWLKGEYQKDLQKHLVVLGRMEKEAGENNKEIIRKATQEVRDLITKYKLEI